MKILLNSKEMEIPQSSTVSGLKEILGADKGGVAVAVNGKIVVAADHQTYILNEGDNVILIGAAYGG